MLVLFAGASGPLGISEIARKLGISKATVHRIVRSLESRQILTSVRQGRAYALGSAAAIIGAQALQRFDFRAAVRPVLHRLQAETDETATMSALIGTARVYLDQVVSLQPIKMTCELGRPFPLHAGASSKAILAFAAEPLRLQVLRGPLTPLTTRTIVDPNALERDLEEIRHTGVAASRGERHPGAASVAAPILGPDGDPLGSLSAAGPADRFTAHTVNQLKPIVIAAGHAATDACKRAQAARA